MPRQTEEYAKYYTEVGQPWCLVLTRGAYASLVRYSIGGVEYEVYVDNEDLIFEEDGELE